MQKEKKGEPFAEALLTKKMPQEEGVALSLSLVIPVYNCAERIGPTLDSIQRQHYPHLEVIIVDAGSTDRTLEIVSSYHPLVSRVYTVAEYNIFEMMNRGLGLISHKYVTFLLPGNLYLSDHVFFTIAQAATESGLPELVYCGSIQRNRKREPTNINYPLQTEILSKGIYPTNLPACFFRSDFFEILGKFDIHLSSRGILDIFSRFVTDGTLQFAYVDRILVDVDYGPLTIAPYWKIIRDTFHILHTHFGLWKAITWFLGLNQLITIKTLWRGFKRKAF